MASLGLGASSSYVLMAEPDARRYSLRPGQGLQLMKAQALRERQRGGGGGGVSSSAPGPQEVAGQPASEPLGFYTTLFHRLAVSLPA